MRKIKEGFNFIISKLFSAQIEFRLRLFNILTLSGIIIGFIMAAMNAVSYKGIANLFTNLAIVAFSSFMLIYSNRSKRYQLCYIISIVVAFLILFPVLFFSSGGYYGGMPLFFAFAIVFTVFMLEGKSAIIMSTIQIIVYLFLFFIAYKYPHTVQWYATDREAAIDIAATFTVVSAALGIAIVRHLREYIKQQRELEKANEQLKQSDRLKTEFLQDIKHEVRNPLHVISLGADFIHNRIDAEYGAEEAHNALNAMQNEAVRLGRMINGMVEMATMSGSATNREKVDIAELLRNCCDAARLHIERKNTVLHLNIPPDLPFVYAEAEQLMRVPVNLLSNAINATQDGEITLETSAMNNYITVIISDNGEGIHPKFLPHVFERGVSGKGGKGYGLSICKTIVEAHGGEIMIESNQGRGTYVTFTIPVYGGQSEARSNE